MSLKNISRDIISKAEEEKKKISSELEVLMSEKKKESDERVNSFKKELKEKFDFDTKSKIKIIKGKAIGEAKKISLDSKSKAVSKTRSDIMSELKDLDGKERKDLIVRLIKIAKKKINYETIYCSKKDLSFVKSKLPGKKVKVKDINGLIFESKSKDEILNLTFEVIASYIFEKHENKIQEILFN